MSAQRPALIRPMATTITAGTAVQITSALVLPSMYSALCPSRFRYLMRK